MSVDLFICAMYLILGVKSLSIFLQIILETAGHMPPSEVDLLLSSEEQSSCYTPFSLQKALFSAELDICFV